MHVNTSVLDYQNNLGSSFHLAEGADTPQALVLSEVKVLHDTDRQFSFSLLFTGTPPLLAQKTYALRHARLGELHLFLVPIGQKAGGYTYQAAFNLLKESESA